ncbi:transient receptor potential cation channel subfamily A member 1 homolog [Ixodes scapularis]|uniref:transient receptor potential cation channel subfamily A member 1 homolog n=1 Tax=Ixodes scapularis TaxID=6945 RepID=UPI001C393EBA|nr:transient receptor potential cation channel subfamily A member 1 homolog [Ixodes scapularis]
MPWLRQRQSSRLSAHLPLRSSKSYPNMNLFQVISEGKEGVLHRYLEDLSDTSRRLKVNDRDKVTGASLVHQAVRVKNSAVLDMLLSYGADPSTKDRMGFTPLHYVAKYVRPEKRRSMMINCEDSASLMVQTLMSAVGDGANAIDAWGMTPLHHAALSGNSHVVRCLLPYASVNKEATDKQGRTALHNAATVGDTEVVRLLLEHGANVNAVDKKGLTAVHIAAKEGSLDALRTLCSDADKDLVNGERPLEQQQAAELLSRKDKQQMTPLHYAVEGKHLEVARYLLERGVNPDAPSCTGHTALHLAAMHCGEAMCRLLVEHGATLDALAEENRTPLLLAATSDRAPIVAFLLDRGAGLEDCDVHGNTALLSAVDGGGVDVVRLLLARGAEVGRRNDRDQNVFHLAVLAKNADVLQELLDVRNSEFLINAKDSNGDTPLHHAASNAFLDIVQLLLRHGANPAAKNISEETTLHSACRYNYPNVVREIVKHDKRLVKETDMQWNTPLHAAAYGGFSETAGVLVEAGADLEAKNYYECTPLTVACQNGDFDTVATLLGAGASVHSVDKMKNRPLHIAAQFGRETVVKLLLNRRDVRDFICKRNANRKNCLDIAIEEDHRNVVEALLKSSFWKELLQNATDSEQNGVHQTPLRSLIRSMPDLATLVFENCVVVEAASDEDPNKSVTYHYQFLDDAFASYGAADDSGDESDSDSGSSIPVRKLYDERGNVLPGTPLYSRDFGTLKHNHPLMIMADEKRRALLGHELCKSLLVHKWESYGRYVYYGTMSVYVLFLACLTSFAVGTPAPCPLDFPHFNTTCSFISRFNSCAVIGEASDEGLYMQTEFARRAKTIIFIVSVIFLLKEMFQIYNTRWNYLDLENLSEWSCYVCSLLFVTNFTDCSYSTGVPEPWQWQLGVVSVFLSWVLLVIYIRKLPFLGIYVVMFTSVLSTFSQFFMVFFLFIVAFALAFLAVFQNQPAFDNPWKAIMKTTVMMVGEMEYDSLFNENVLPYETASYILMALFLVLMTIITSNLLVGLAVDDIKVVLEQAELKRLGMQVKLVLTVETMLPTWARRQVVVQKRTVRPNRKSRIATLMRRLFGINIHTFQPGSREEKYTVEKVYEHQEGMERLLRHLEERMDILAQQGHRLEKALNALGQRARGGSERGSTGSTSPDDV